MDEMCKRALSAALEKDDRAWHAFEQRTDQSSGSLQTSDIPFPDSFKWPHFDDFMMKESQRNSGDPVEMFRTLARRWHPDKFKQKFAMRLDPAHHDEIVGR